MKLTLVIAIHYTVLVAYKCPCTSTIAIVAVNNVSIYLIGALEIFMFNSNHHCSGVLSVFKSLM